MNSVEKLKNAIEESARSKGLFLHRYQTNIGRYSVVITYALHDSEQKPRKSADCSDYTVVMNNREGSTERCEAFKQLEKMYNYLNQLSIEFN